MKSLFVTLFILALSYGSSFALPPKEKAELSDLIAYALEHNPGWAAQGKMVDRQKAGIDGAGGWQNAKLKYNQFLEPIETKLGPQNYQVTLSQPLPFLSESGLKEEVAQYQTEAAIHAMDQAKRRLIRNIKATYYDLWQLEEIPKLLAENQKVVERMATLGSFESQRNSKMLSLIFKAQAKVGENAFDLIEMEDRLFNAKTRLSNLLGHPGEELIQSVQVPKLPSFNAEMAPLVQRALETHPDLKKMDEELRAADSMETLQSRSRWMPKFELSLNYFNIGEPTDGSTPNNAGKDAYSIALGMSLPFGSSINSSKHEQAKAQKEIKSLQRQQRAHDLKEAVTRTFNRVVNAQRLVKVFDEQLLPPARRSQKLSERLYSSGTKNMMTALEAKTHLLNLEIRAVKARANYLKALVDLEELIGMDLSQETEEEAPEDSKQNEES